MYGRACHPISVGIRFGLSALFSEPLWLGGANQAYTMSETSFGAGWNPTRPWSDQEMLAGSSDPDVRKRWGEYQTDEPNAHGSFGNTDGFSRFRQNVDLCHNKPALTEFEGNAGHMYPPPLVRYDMTQETHTNHNHCRRVKQNKVFDVFPLNDSERTDEQGNKILSEGTREGLASNAERFYRSRRNERIFRDHTSEIRRRVAENLKKKRYEELKDILRTLAILNPTLENWARYREICELDVDEDDQFSEEQSEIRKEFLRRLDQSIAFTQNTRAKCGSGGTEPFYLKRATKGILRQPENSSNQFTRPWADPRLVFALTTWEPNRKCHPRACRRVRFKDEIYDDLGDTDCGQDQISSDKNKEVANVTEKVNGEWDEPENLYYDKEVCTNIASRLTFPFKTEACKRFHQKYTDPLPDLRTYHTFAKKHFFNGFHTSAFRG